MKRPAKDFITPSPIKRTRVVQISPTDIVIRKLAMSDAGQENKGNQANHGNGSEASMVPDLIPRQVFGFPPTLLTKLRYKEQQTLTASSGLIASIVYSANGIYDPNISQTGHQPMYRDAYANIYNSYVVIGSRIRATFVNEVDGQTLVVGILGDDNDVNSSNITEKGEQNFSFTDIIGSSQGGRNSTTIENYYDPLLHLGVAAKDDGQSVTGMGSNPANQWCYHMFAAASDLTTSEVRVWVDIEYTVKCSELITPSGS